MIHVYVTEFLTIFLAEGPSSLLCSAPFCCIGAVQGLCAGRDVLSLSPPGVEGRRMGEKGSWVLDGWEALGNILLSVLQCESCVAVGFAVACTRDGLAF